MRAAARFTTAHNQDHTVTSTQHKILVVSSFMRALQTHDQDACSHIARKCEVCTHVPLDNYSTSPHFQTLCTMTTSFINLPWKNHNRMHCVTMLIMRNIPILLHSVVWAPHIPCFISLRRVGIHLFHFLSWNTPASHLPLHHLP